MVSMVSKVISLHGLHVLQGSNPVWIFISPSRVVCVRSAMRVPMAWLVVWGIAAGLAGQPQAAQVWTFDAERPGSPPAGFALTPMRQESAGTWLVRRDGANGVVVHEGNPANAGFALAVSDAPPFRDGTVSVRLRLAGG